VSETRPAVEWSRYHDCPTCGVVAGKPCFNTNGGRKKWACAQRPLTTDALLDLLADAEADRLALRAELAELRDLLARHAAALDILLPQLTEDEAA